MKSIRKSLFTNLISKNSPQLVFFMPDSQTQKLLKRLLRASLLKRGVTLSGGGRSWSSVTLNTMSERQIFYSVLQYLKLWQSPGLVSRKISSLRLFTRRHMHSQFQLLAKEESQKLPSKYGSRFIQNRKLLNKTPVKSLTEQRSFWGYQRVDFFSSFLGVNLGAGEQFLSHAFFRKNFIYFIPSLTYFLFYQIIILHVRLQLMMYARLWATNLIRF